MNRLPLELLNPGEEARISDLEGGMETTTRLREMGLREGAQVRMLRAGTTCIIALGHQRVSFRGEDAASVFVEPINGSGNGSE